MGKEKKYEKSVFPTISWPIVPFHSVLFLHKLVSVFIVVIYINLLIVFLLWPFLPRFYFFFFFIDNWSLEIFWCIFCVDLFESTIEKFEILCITWNRLLCVVPTSCTFFYWKILLNSTSERHWIIACYTFIFEQSWFGWFLNMLTIENHLNHDISHLLMYRRPMV